MAQTVDVLICGGGSAGLCAALWLSRHGVDYKILERRPGPLEVGQADGVQTRMMEIFESFGLGDEVLKEACHVLELAFWKTADDEEGEDDGATDEAGKKDGKGRGRGIRKLHYAPDKETDISHQPHVILNQARMNALLLGQLSEDSPVEYGCDVQNVEVDSETAADADAYCVRVVAEKDGTEIVYQAKYVLGCDGAHSTVRRSLGYKMVGDTSDAVWGVMDIYPRTDFPDIRKKAVLQSPAGNLLIIPREGDSMVRFYTELPAGTQPGSVKLEDLQETARLIFVPYSLEIAETFWWSAYSIGQRLADGFHRDHRVFLTGDACHTHSPKAGQGMNVSLQDGYNLGWKLGHVLRRRAVPALLETYVSERRRTAADLIDFDRYFTRLFSSRYRRENGVSALEFARQFVRAGRYTAGQATRYRPSMIVDAPSSPGATAETEEETDPKKIVAGMRLPSAQVVRYSDARPVQLLPQMRSDCRWRIVVFAGDLVGDRLVKEGLDQVAKSLGATIRLLTPSGEDPDSVVEPILVLATKRTEIEPDSIPSLFTPVTGRWKIKNLHKVFVDDESYNSGHGHAFNSYGISLESPRGLVVVVRPDQHVAKVCKFEEVDSVRQFLLGFMIPPS